SPISSGIIGGFDLVKAIEAVYIIIDERYN
ncbi:MAG: hypothetical protein CFH07_02015, partial [Alphaproteobacteria bacterium MarineAlpha3_Bin6]